MRSAACVSGRVHRSSCPSSRWLQLPRRRWSLWRNRALYHCTSDGGAGQFPYAAAERLILGAALHRVREHGFTRRALTKGAQDAGYLPASLALLPRGVFELVMYHCVVQRVELKEKLPWISGSGNEPASHHTGALSSRLRQTMLTRLHGNTDVIAHYTEALALMSLTGNIPASLAELGRLADEMLYLAGDTSVDTSWYLQRAAIAGVYASAETFMTQDQSTAFKDTEKFLHRRLEDVRVLGRGAADVGQFLAFAGISTVNILRSWNVRI